MRAINLIPMLNDKDETEKLTKFSEIAQILGSRGKIQFQKMPSSNAHDLRFPKVKTAVLSHYLYTCSTYRNHRVKANSKGNREEKREKRGKKETKEREREIERG